MAKKLMKGTEVVAAAAMAAGCEGYFGYPITPQNEVGEYIAARLKESKLAFCQAESELAAANMLYGAAASGARVMTSSSSPGIALKQEVISYLAGAQIPAVILSASRSGPGLGGILPSQADYFQSTRGGGNGDYNTIVIAPSNLQEMAEMVAQAFELSEKYRNPVMILADGILVQMMEPVDLSKIKATKKSREGFATGRGSRKEPTIVTSLFLNADDLEAHNWKLQDKYKEIKAKETIAATDRVEDADVLIVAYGSAARICKNAIDALREDGIKAGLFRPVTLWPFPEKELEKAAKGKKILVAELSCGQMIQDVKLTLGKDVEIEFHGRPGGNVFLPEDIEEVVKKMVKGK